MVILSRFKALHFRVEFTFERKDYICVENEAIHKKDYSVVKTSRAGRKTRSFLLERYGAGKEGQRGE